MEIEQAKQTIIEHGYEYKKIIGKGGFSNVYLCHSQKYNQDFAIKQAKKNKITRYEFNMLVSLNHPNIIKLYDFFEDDSSQYLVMEYCPNGTILQKGKLSYGEFIYYSKQVLDALEYCHSNKIAHRDIKPENILIDDYNNVKLADFGFAKNFDEYSKSGEKCGTIKYFSPEMFLDKEICPFKADIWALGITFYRMATGKYPFVSYSTQKLKQSILIGELDFFENKVDQRIQNLIIKMAQIKPSLRPTSKKLLNSQIFQELKDIKKFIKQKLIVRPNISSNRSFILKSSSLDNVKHSAPLTKLHSYKSMNHFPGIQQINGHLILSKM